MSSTSRASKREAPDEAFAEADFERFYQAHKRLKAASDIKDEEIARLQASLDETKIKEEKSRKDYEYAATFRIDWIENYNKEHEKVEKLRFTIGNLEGNVRSLEAENKRLIEESHSSAAANCEQLETDKAALEAQLAEVEQAHKALLHKFDGYRKRLRKMCNEA